MANGVDESIRELDEAIATGDPARICEATRVLRMACVNMQESYEAAWDDSIASKVRDAFLRATKATMGSGVYEKNIAIRADRIFFLAKQSR